MKIRSLTIIVLLGVLLPTTTAHAQKATERFIPIGKSPGLSGKYTVIGRVKEIDPKTGTLTIITAGRTWTAMLCERTNVWLDCSSKKHPSVIGSPRDCRPGLLCEIKYVGHPEPTSATCDWIKIRPAAYEGAARTSRR